MSEPTIGVGRITIPYVATGLEHVCRMFVDNPTAAGSTYNISLHPSIGGTADWTNAAQGLADALSSALATGVTPGTALLEEYSATGWIPRDTVTVTFPNLSGNTALASQITLTLRAMDFTRPKIVLMECNQDPPFKYNTPTGGPGGLDGMIDPFLGSSSVSSRPWAFMVTMHGIFLLEEDFVSVTGTFNRKLRRARGLA